MDGDMGTGNGDWGPENGNGDYGLGLWSGSVDWGLCVDWGLKSGERLTRD
jgi:hypothetical protein